MIGLTTRHRFFMYNGYCDMRKGFDGLSGVVINEMGQDVLDGSVYIFINKRCNRMKMLVWESGGFMLYYKRLEMGTFEFPRQEDGSKIEINWEILVLMIQGIRLQKITRKKRYKRA